MEYALDRQPLHDKKIGWLGNYYFNPQLFLSGYTIVHHSPTDTVLDWDALVEIFGFEPDILVYADRSVGPYLKGVESFPCLTVFLCVDTHIHSWYPQYSRGFDLLTVSLKDHISEFIQAGFPEENILWLPPYARMEDVPLDVEKEWDLLFVGNDAPDIFPFRHQFLKKLKKRIPALEVRKGAYRELFPKAKLVLNIAERGDLNYRVFEALGCGSCLVTPQIGHGQSDLFEDGVDVFTYNQTDMDDLVRVVEHCLQDDDLRERVAQSGFEKVDTLHRASHRALEFLDFIERCGNDELVHQRLKNKEAIFSQCLRMIYLHYAEVLDDIELKNRYLTLARG